jgi:preprotein translocase subunit SecA
LTNIRENIHLVVLGNQDPLDEFHKAVGTAFADLWQAIDDRVVQTFHAARITSNGIDLQREKLAAPSSTWTYLINDNPFGDVLQRLFRGLKRTINDGARS